MTEIERSFIEEVISWGSEPQRNLEEDEDKELYLAEIKGILDQFTEFEYDIQAGGVVIKFPDYICRDSYGNTTPIYNPFVLVRVNRKVNFRRTKFTQMQYNGNYIHSHVSGSSNRNNWASSTQICYGMNIVKQASFLETLITVLTFYPTFLKEESSMTSPHKRIGSLGLGGNLANDAVSIANYSLFIQYLQVKIKNFYGLQQLYITVRDEEAFNNALIESGAFCYELEGRKYRTLNISNEEEKVLSNNLIFKGLTQPIYIVRDEIQIPQKSVCLITMEHILNELNQYINEPEFFQSQTNTDNSGQSTVISNR